MNIVFLDIDGVLQPKNSEDHFYEYNYQTRKLIQDLSEKYQIDYTKYSYIDILSTYYDWKEEAIGRIKWVLNNSNAKIIVSSDWRNKKMPNKMPDLLKIHNLDHFWYNDNIILEDNLPFAEKRYREIKDSLNRYQIDNYVVLDDNKELFNYFPNNSVITYDYISLDDANKAVKILKR